MDAQAFQLCIDFVNGIEGKYPLSLSKPWLVGDVGSYNVNGCYRPIFDKIPFMSYEGLDIAPGPNVDKVLPSEYEGWGEPIYDIVISGQCLEHVPKPWKWIKALSSICKQGALVFISAPNTWEFHPYPVDCWRVWPDGLKALFEEGSIETIEAFTEDRFTIGVGKKS